MTNIENKIIYLRIATIDASESQYLFIFNKLLFFNIYDNHMFPYNIVFMTYWVKDVFSDFNNGFFSQVINTRHIIFIVFLFQDLSMRDSLKS